MSNYRIYALDGDGRLGLPDWIEAADDRDAIERARALKQTARKCEVWERNRLVARLDAQSLTA
jgi:hypothetical protein